MRRRPLSLLAVVVAALALAACGGEDPPTAAEYRADAGRVCGDALRAQRAVSQPTRATPEAVADYFAQLLRASERSTRRFRTLDPPESLQAAHDQALEVSERIDAQARDIVRRLRTGEEPQTVLASVREPLQGLRSQSAAAARRLGVRACAAS